jgi:hypothetical protein
MYKYKPIKCQHLWRTLHGWKTECDNCGLTLFEAYGLLQKQIAELTAERDDLLGRGYIGAKEVLKSQADMMRDLTTKIETLRPIYTEMRTILASQLTKRERRLYRAIQGILEGK